MNVVVVVLIVVAVHKSWNLFLSFQRKIDAVDITISMSVIHPWAGLNY